MHTAANRAIRIGRATALAIGVGVMLAVVLGAGTIALAAVPGDPFRLGQNNVINGAITSLVGARAGGAMMLVDNNSSAIGSRALDLRTEAGRAPLTVSPEAGKAPNLNADKVDGREAASFANGTGGRANDADKLDGLDSTAFLPASIYFDSSDAVSGNGGGAVFVFIASPCDPGDKILNAGAGVAPEDDMIEQRPVGSAAWLVRIRDNGAPATSNVVANCVDLPPLRP